MSFSLPNQDLTEEQVAKRYNCDVKVWRDTLKEVDEESAKNGEFHVDTIERNGIKISVTRK